MHLRLAFNHDILLSVGTFRNIRESFRMKIIALYRSQKPEMSKHAIDVYGTEPRINRRNEAAKKEPIRCSVVGLSGIING